MLPPVHRGSGTNIAVPDVCNTPIGTGTSPVTYVNTADCTQSVSFSTVVMIANSNACNTSSQVNTTTGDEAGTAHYSIKGNSLWTAGNAVVMIESKPAVTLSSPTSQNKGNAVGTTTVPSVSTVLFTRRSGPSPSHGPPTTDQGLLQITLAAFDLPTPGRLEQCLEKERPHGLLLDLRGSPGGRLDVLTRLASLFLPRDTPLLVREGDGVSLPLCGTRTPIAPTIPIAIVVDGITASAAELFAAVLQHHGRARVFGQPTWGKSRMLRFDAPEPVTVGRCLLPDGTDLEGEGMVPDVLVETGDARAAAVEWLLPLCSQGDER